MQSDIPDKLYFKIGEVSKLVGVEPYVLRYWETEFDDIKPRRARSNQRMYKRADVELILKVRTLLHDQGYTIQGARHYLATHKEVAWESQEPQPAVPATDHKKIQTMLADLKNELNQLQTILKKKS